MFSNRWVSRKMMALENENERLRRRLDLCDTTIRHQSESITNMHHALDQQRGWIEQQTSRISKLEKGLAETSHHLSNTNAEVATLNIRLRSFMLGLINCVGGVYGKRPSKGDASGDRGEGSRSPADDEGEEKPESIGTARIRRASSREDLPKNGRASGR
jgi:uncharacterized coiled-coil protein SlyX